MKQQYKIINTAVKLYFSETAKCSNTGAPGGTIVSHNCAITVQIFTIPTQNIHVRRIFLIKQAVREAAIICPPCKLTFDLLTLKVVSELYVTSDVGYLCVNVSFPMLRPDVRHVRRASSLNGSALWGRA